MDLLTTFLISISLAMDAFAVSITFGINIKFLKLRDSFKIALYFGSFQAFMPIIGWLFGYGLQKYISQIDHWIAFFLLSFVGLKMIYESIKKEENEKKISSVDRKVLFYLSVATSIDALAIGVSLSFLNTILTPALIIGIVTFSLSFVGVHIGNRFGHFGEKKYEIIGGLILIFIGIKILYEHIH